ncbi:uncharacterized protein LOC124465354 [Hypomesus transpacificus]|uniref:uncharacterized protein LOC124465354 n=1 Tax=Hypomesus transpacificus TaxID=137520 RepID=UPI001F07CA6A|nr:uncharacterized protein LOC124465354 [Hypomesus transpacificus]
MMASQRPSDNFNQGGRLTALSIKQKHFLSEVRKRSDGASGEASPPIKRGCVVGPRGKPRGRCGGRRQGSTTGTPSSAEESSPELQTQEEFDRNMEKLSEILKSCPVAMPTESPQTFSSWPSRHLTAQEHWEEARPFHLKCLLDSEDVGQELCYICQKTAVIRCRDCLPEEWLCEACDVHIHKRWPLHNRDSVVDGFFRAIPPSTYLAIGEAGHYTTQEQACILPTVRAPKLCSCEVANVTVLAGRAVILITMNGRYDLHKPVYLCNICMQKWTPEVRDLIKSGYWPATTLSQTLYSVDLLSSFQELKGISPGLSRQAFTKLLEHRTQRAGRSGQINGDALQRSFLEFMYCSFQKEQLCCVTPFTCPACTPQTVAVSVDGNRKLYRFQRSGSSDEAAFFDGLFLAKDREVACFVDLIHSAVKSTQGRGTCGTSQWTAARETSRRANKLDEEGVEVAVCRHGYLLKGLSMYRGEIFAYPLYLQKELHATENIRFFAMDVACKYWPYLEKVAGVVSSLQGLLDMKPFLSIMHARAHATKCEIKWSGRNQSGAGTTAGEEVEQVNSFLSRCALTTKYMSKSARVDMLTVHAMVWNRYKGETLHQALSTRYVKTCQRAVVEAAKLSELKVELHCSDQLALEWVADVQDWAVSGKDGTPPSKPVPQTLTFRLCSSPLKGFK